MPIRRIRPAACTPPAGARHFAWLLALLALAACGCRRETPPRLDGVAPAGDATRRSQDYSRIVDAIPHQYPGVRHVTLAAVLAEREAGVASIWVDARTVAERAVSGIPGAVPFDAVVAEPAVFQGKPLMVYCTIGHRSADAARRLTEQGLDARNLLGGITAWARAGQPLVDPDGTLTTRVHTYSAEWDYLPPAYQPVH